MSIEYFSQNSFELRCGKDALRAYVFGDQLVNHYFCKICGVHTFHEGVQKPGQFRVNLNCVPEITLAALELVHIDGASF